MVLKKNSLSCQPSVLQPPDLKLEALVGERQRRDSPRQAKQGRSARNRQVKERSLNAGGTRHGVARALTAVAAASPTQAQRSRAEPNQTPPHHTATPQEIISPAHLIATTSTPRVCSGPASPRLAGRRPFGSSPPTPSQVTPRPVSPALLPPPRACWRWFRVRAGVVLWLYTGP
jgi:hypothetical protein